MNNALDDAQLREVVALQRLSLDLLEHDRESIRRYLERGMVSRALPVDGEANPTCTAFVLFYLSGASLIGRDGSPTYVLSKAESDTAVAQLGKELEKKHRLRRRNGGGRRSRTTTGALPNQYNSAIQVAGYLRAARRMQIEVGRTVNAACKRVVDYLVSTIDRKGFVSRLEAATSPSQYLTFWAAQAITSWQDSNAKYATRYESQLRAVLLFAEHGLKGFLAYHHAGFRSRVDVVEALYACATVLQLGSVQRRDSDLQSPEQEELAGRVLRVLLSEYFDHGTFHPSAPVISDTENTSVQCSTCEALATLLLVKRKSLADHWSTLGKTLTWVRIHRRSQGWATENHGTHEVPNAFMTSAALAFIAGFSELLDDVLHEGAISLLSLPLVPAKVPSTFTYPGGLAKIVSTNVVKPLTESPMRRDIASYSMLLFGPPGTAKTTVAKKLASDLGWPLLVINQASFLQRGIPNMDAEAERVFRLVGHLKNAVVLFDEVEELIEVRSTSDKSSRLLTTAMLPRLHDLRDRRRIVFIFATNHLKHIDDAASRLGRFDIVQAVLPPTKRERDVMFKQVVAEFGFEGTHAKQILRASDRCDDFCYVDLHALVRFLRVRVELAGESLSEELIDQAVEAFQRRVRSDAFRHSLDEAKKDQSTYGRP